MYSPVSSAVIADTVIDELNEQVGAATVSRLMRVYRDGIGHYRDAIACAAEQGDLHNLGVSLHALKSSSNSIGGLVLDELAGEGEQLARTADRRALNLVPSILTALDAFCRALSAHPLLDCADARSDTEEDSALQPT